MYKPESYQARNGKTRWILAEYNENNGQWTAPIHPEIRKSNPSTYACFSNCFESLTGDTQSYSTKANALRALRRDYGNEIDLEATARVLGLSV
jgi:hypothetical protein